ncbi:transmembrane protein, putative (macronuclear) [Tetrahymena thermophila SB210]|uniref:Transmembrane protein, putative n=1 Tax=Tetrahymena thermophila (strain SB210) TaxID=312017 RepID=X1W3N3_TETTS|nr:transmembrane protein, putative [Tetrahymena thermophila SB210]EAR93916.2 transmembrane protein, putative [Tetrahymena thermophila SB210]|eukprot:XP_001014161.2 transmembrane protein, putative [Tetrahymena thermophila SB210]
MKYEIIQMPKTQQNYIDQIDFSIWNKRTFKFKDQINLINIGMKIALVLLLCLFLVQANQESDRCINQCVGHACKGEQDQFKCLKVLSSEVKCFKNKCNPAYKSDCVNNCCTSKACKNLISCAEDCPSSQLEELHHIFLQRKGQYIMHDLTEDQNSQFKLADATNPHRNNASTSSSHLFKVVFLLLGLTFIYY